MSDSLRHEIFVTPDKAASAKERKVRVSAVDNFQGEENDIIIVSLVRFVAKMAATMNNMI